MELQNNIAIKYHLAIHKLTATYPSELDIEMDILFLLLEHNKKKRRKKIKGDLPTAMFQEYYNGMEVDFQPLVLEVFKKLKDQNYIELSDDMILVSQEFINKYVK